jgi:hypothetical protein
MKNRFESRKTLNLQIGGPSGAANVNPLQPKSEIKEAPSAAAILSIEKIMANIGEKTQSTLAGDGVRSVLQDVA